MEPLWNLRLSTEDDLPFILSSWLRGHRKASVTSGISNTIYYRSQEALLKKLLAASVVVVACAKDDVDQIFGYVCYEAVGGINLAVHWVYVKQPFRSLGMARDLLQFARSAEHQVEWHTSRTRPSALTAAGTYNPYLIWSYA